MSNAPQLVSLRSRQFLKLSDSVQRLAWDSGGSLSRRGGDRGYSRSFRGEWSSRAPTVECVSARRSPRQSHNFVLREETCPAPWLSLLGYQPAVQQLEDVGPSPAMGLHLLRRQAPVGQHQLGSLIPLQELDRYHRRPVIGGVRDPGELEPPRRIDRQI